MASLVVFQSIIIRRFLTGFIFVRESRTFLQWLMFRSWGPINGLLLQMSKALWKICSATRCYPMGAIWLTSRSFWKHWQWVNFSNDLNSCTYRNVTFNNWCTHLTRDSRAKLEVHELQRINHAWARQRCYDRAIFLYRWHLLKLSCRLSIFMILRSCRDRCHMCDRRSAQLETISSHKISIARVGSCW